MIRGLFIGIDRHRDPGIRELTGAGRDATALWSLFLDSIPEMNAVLLRDSQATLADLRAALQNSLGSAVADDVVIVSFSGHGTHSHRLVAHDTDKQDLDETTIGMDELAELFRRSAARAILCVIDCCFSGGAPARVLEDSPIPKDTTLPLEILSGKGRILISASKLDELAYEMPGARHGLLTKALLEALQADGPMVDVTEAMAKVMASVRAAAAQLGVTQTPVMFGQVEGGLALPVLRPGARYRQAFPEVGRVPIGSALEELSAFGLPAELLKAWAGRFSGGLNKLQLTAVNDYRVLNGESLLVIAPTSSGKTFIGELGAARALAAGQKAVFLLPYRALVNEKYDDFLELYGDALGMRVVRCAGDYTDDVAGFVRGKYDLGLLTYEMFLNLAVGNAGVLNLLGLVALDEAQFITDPARGITVELLLTYLLAGRDRGIRPQLIALSAVIGNSNGLEDWLGCGRLVTLERPVPLVEGVFDRTGQLRYIDANGTEKTEALVPHYEIQQRGAKPSAQDMIVPLTRNLIRKGNEKIIVFRNQRGAAEGCAHYLANELGLPPAADAIALLPEADLSTTAASLRECLAHGTAFHNTNLTREEKQVVERAFRIPEGPLRVLAATTTLAAGINTPASTVLIAEQRFVGEDGREFTIAEYKNMAGRAGRLGFNEKGKAIILANDPSERDALFRKYVLGQPEALASSFEADQLETWIVRLLVQVKAIVREDVARLLANTYGGFLANRAYPGWRAEMEARVSSLLDRMLALGLLENEAGALRLTLLGRACGQSALALSSSMRLVELLRAAGPGLTAEQLMALSQALPESDGGYTPLFKKGPKEAVRPNQAAQRFGQQVVALLQRYVEDQHDYWARCKRASILWDWISGTPVSQIEQVYSVTPFAGKIGYGDIRRFADTTRFHLRAGYQIAAALFTEYGTRGEAVDILLKRLEIGLPTGALGLLALPLALDRGEYLALHARGTTSAADVWRLSDDELRAVIAPRKGRLLAEMRPLKP